MKFILFSLLFSFSSAPAAQDSVAVFHRSEKVVVLLNEQYQGRLQAFMNHLGAGKELLLESQDGSIRLDCGRRIEVATCTFRFLPSENVHIAEKNLVAAATFQELQLSEVSDFIMSFESSREDKMTLQIQNRVLKIQASKR